MLEVASWRDGLGRKEAAAPDFHMQANGVAEHVLPSLKTFEF